MADILEFILGLIALRIYGTESHPRRPFWRNSLRTFVFGGAAFAVINILKIFGPIDVPVWLTVLWGSGLVMVLSAEYYVGIPWLAAAVGACGAIVLALALWTS